MEQIILKANKRDLLGKKVKILRGKGQIPVVLYGRNFKPMSLAIDARDFRKISQIASESTIINLDLDSQKYPTLIRDIQRHPVSDEILHVDLYKVDMSQEIQTEIPLKFIGTSQAVEELEGNFITNRDSIKVECLPDKLVSELEVDISVLKTFQDLIHVKDLKIPEGIKVLEDAQDIVAQVTAPLSEDELKAMEAETAATTEKAQIENIEAEAEKEKAEKTEGEEETAEAAPETPQTPEQQPKKE